MKNKLLILFIAMLALLLCFSACVQKPEEENPDDGSEAQVTITSIEVVSGSVPTTIELDATPDFSGIKVNVNYSDGTSKQVGFADVKIGQVDTLSTGKKNVTVTYEGVSTQFEVNVIDPDETAYVTSINIVPGSIASAYYIDQMFDVSKLQVEATYNTGKVNVLSPEEYTYSTVDTSKVGEHTFTVTYTADPQLTASVKVNVLGIKSIKVITSTIASKINVGEKLDTSKLQVIVEFADGKTFDVDASGLTIGTIDTTSYGKKDLSITYKGVTIKYTIEVVGPVSITVNKGSYPAKVKVLGAYSAPDITGYVTFSDDTKKTLEAKDFSSISTIDTSKAGSQKLTVAYEGLETTVYVEVVGVSTLEVISGVANEVLKGAALDTSNIRVSVKYTDNTTDVVGADALTLGTVDTTTAGEKKLSVTHLDKSIEYAVKVCKVTSIEIGGVSKTVQSGTEVDLSNLQVYAVYNDSRATKVEVTAEENATITKTVYPSDKNSLENRVLTVTYKGVYGEFSTTFDITATNAALVDIEIEYKSEVLLGGQYDKTNVTVKEVYGNDQKVQVVNFTIAGIDTTKAGKQTLTVTYTKNGVTYTKQGEVTVCKIDSIRVTGLPESVPAGEDIDLAGIKVYGIYNDSNGTEIEIKGGTITNTFKACDNFNKIEDKTFTITCQSAYGTFSTTVKVKASRPLLDSITISNYDTEVLVGTDYNKNSVSITATYGNGDTASDVIGFVVSDVATGTLGDAKLTVTYTERGIEKSADVMIAVCSFEKLEIRGVDIHLPVGETLDTENMEIVGVYKTTMIPLSKDNIIERNDAEVNANEDHEATTTFKVVYYDEKYGRVEGTLPISAQPPVLEGIEFVNYDKAIVPGVDYKLANVTLKAMYGNGAEPALQYNTEGLTLAFDDDGVTLVATYTVGETTVTKSVELRVAEVEKFIIKNPVTSVISAELIDIGGIEVYKVYNDDGKTEIKVTDFTTNIEALNANPNTTDNRTLEVYYGGTTVATQLIETKKAKVDTITISKYTNEVLYGVKYDTSNVEITATLKNGQSEDVDLDNTGLVLEYNEQTSQIVATYTDTYGVTVYAVPVSVKICTIENLVYVSGIPASVKYGQTLVIDTNNVVVYGKYNTTQPTTVESALDTSCITVNSSQVNVNKAGSYPVTITYIGENGSGEVTVYVEVEQPAFTGIQISGGADKVGVGATYNTENVVVNAVYQNGVGEQLLTGFTMTIDTSKVGTTQLKVTYNDGTNEWTATKDVQVCAIASIELSGLPAWVAKGGTLDTTNIKVTVKFEGGAPAREVSVSDVTIALDTATAGDKKVKVTYLGFTQEADCHVRGVQEIKFFDDFNTIRDGHEVDFDNIMIHVIYTNGDEEQKKLSAIDGITKKEATAQIPVYDGDEITGYKVTVTIKHADATEITRDLKVIKLAYIHALTGSIPASVLQGTKFELGNVKIALVYDNGETHLINSSEYEGSVTIVTIDTNTAGNKAIKISYTENGVTYKTEVTVSVLGVSKVEVVEKSVRQKLYVGETLAQDKYLTNLLVKVIYSDGSYTYVKYPNVRLEIVSLPNTTNTTTEDDPAKLVVKYLDVEGSIPVSIVARPENSGSSGFIFGTLRPDELVARDSYKGNFKDGSSAYYVGDDNEYRFYLNVIILDSNNNIVETDGTTEPVALTVTMNGSTVLDARESAGKVIYSTGGVDYLEFDPSDNGYDFTDAAIGNKYELKIKPKDSSRYVDENEVTQSHTVTVVDGYNVYEAWELNLMTNSTRDITQKCFGSENSVTQVTVVDKYLWDEHKATRPERLAAIILHGNIDVKPGDVPPEYFYYENGERVGLFDHVGLFHRNLSPEEKSFKIYGNYFSVYSYGMDCVVPKGVANNDDDYSSSDLFRVRLTSSAHDYIAKKATKDAFSEFVVDIRDIATRDNDPNSNDQSASERHMRGLACYKMGETVINMTNVNVDAYMTSMIVENMGSTLNLNNVKFYNSWQGHLFLWSLNEHQLDRGGEKQETWSYIPNLKVNITNSLLAKSGGPVILAQTPHVNYDSERNCGVDVTADAASEIWTYVTGQEAWFVAVGQTQMATQIRAMSPLIGQAVGQGNGFTSMDHIQGVETVNMMMVAMGNAGTGLEGAGTPNATFTKGDVMVIQSHHDKNTTTFQNAELDYAIAQVLEGMKLMGIENPSAPPMFQTDAHGLAYTDGKSVTPLNAQFASGNSITLYYKDVGACIAMQYYHPKQAN